MKASLKTKIIEELRQVPIIEHACEKCGISRQTFYRWRNANPAFAAEVDEAMQFGTDRMNDISETHVLNGIRQGDFKFVSFWLRFNSKKYKRINETEKENKDGLPDQTVIGKIKGRLVKIFT